MDASFSADYVKFKAKIEGFTAQTNFTEKTKEYTDSFNKMASVSPDDMKLYIQKSPDFLPARNESLSLMERVVEIHHKLEEIFAMDETTLYLKCRGDLASIDKEIALHVKEAAQLLHRFEKVSKIGRKAIEKVDNPFFAQGEK